MNSSHQNHDLDSEEQAALWAARLEGSALDAADHAALNTWLDSNSSHRTLLSQYCQFSADLEQQLPMLLATGAITMPPEQLPDRRRNVVWITGTALAAAAVVAFVVWLGSPNRHFERIATSAGQRQSLTLPDGTRVELNARTNLVIENGRFDRRVRLVDGEAFFIVSKDKTRPFIVETPAGSVRVTGTTFDVRSETTSELDVTVVEGSVQVHPGELADARPRAPVLLNAGNRLSAGTVQTLSSTALDDTLAWREGKIVFDGVPLHDALARYAYYHGRGITVSPGAANLRVSGRYSLDDLDEFLTTVEQFLPVHHVAARDLSGNVRVSLRSEP